MVIKYLSKLSFCIGMASDDFVPRWEFKALRRYDRKTVNQVLKEHKGFRSDWMDLWSRVTGADGSSIYEEMISNYSAEERHYHNLAHLAELFYEFEQVKEELSSPDDVALAIWGHDEVYHTHAKNNELESAKKMMNRLMVGWWDGKYHPQFARPYKAIKIYNMINKTTHDKKVLSKDTKYLLDLDLAPMGYPEEHFVATENDIGKEFGWVPKDIYREARTNVLKAFLNRKNIYRTERFRDLYEVQARKNLKGSVEMLSR